jgi:hypothetical protein
MVSVGEGGRDFQVDPKSETLKFGHEKTATDAFAFSAYVDRGYPVRGVRFTT